MTPINDTHAPAGGCNARLCDGSIVAQSARLGRGCGLAVVQRGQRRLRLTDTAARSLARLSTAWRRRRQRRRRRDDGDQQEDEPDRAESHLPCKADVLKCGVHVLALARCDVKMAVCARLRLRHDELRSDKRHCSKRRKPRSPAPRRSGAVHREVGVRHAGPVQLSAAFVESASEATRSAVRMRER